MSVSVRRYLNFCQCQKIELILTSYPQYFSVFIVVYAVLNA